MINNVGTIYSAIGTQFLKVLVFLKLESQTLLFCIEKNSLKEQLEEQNYDSIRKIMRENAETFLITLKQKSVT